MQNKYAISRYKLIDARIIMKQRNAPSLIDLVDYVSEKLETLISESTIQKDIYAMRFDQGLGFFAPIVFDRKQKGYIYTDSDYSINKIAVSAEDLQGLELAIGILEQFKDLPAIKIFDDAISKIATSIKYNMEQNSSSKILYLDRPKRYMGIEFLNDVVDAIRNRKVLKIQYKSFTKGELKKHIVHPYFVKEYNGRMYLVAKDIHPTKASKFLTFSFDRMIQLLNTNQTFMEEEMDPENYFQSTIGISLTGKNPEKIILKFDISQKNYVQSQPLHHSQKIIKETKSHLLIEIFVVINYEFSSLLLSLKDNVTVIKPLHLAKEIKEMALKIAQRYK